MDKINKIIVLSGVFLFSILGFSQEADSTAVATEVASVEMIKDSVKPFKRVKLDGISAVIGDYVILDSDVQKTFIDLKSQGVDTKDITECSLLGKLMEDRLYAHQAVQDSLLVSDDEVNGNIDRQIQSFVSQIGSMEKLLKFYKKPNEQELREDLFEINKLRMLSERMQASIVSEIEITPEEVRQFFNKIPKDERPVFGAELEISQIVKIPKATEKEKQKVIDKLKTIRADILDNDASFKIKAILHSEDEGSKAKGGFYSIDKNTAFVKEFMDVAYSLQQGEISEPFETEYGYHIMLVEKIRGQERDIRHIIISPDVPESAKEAAKAELDSIRTKVNNGDFTFAEGALNFSDEKETKFDGGVLRNPTDFSARFELTKMDPSLYNQVRNLKDNEVSTPIYEEDPKGGIKYKIYKITNRFDEHVASYSQDYLKIQQLAKTEKQFEAIKEWMEENIQDTYISVNEEKRDCDFSNNWVKE